MIKLDHKNYHVPGIIVAFSKGSDLPEAFSSGLADVDMGTSWPLSGRFQIGQITETLCVALVLNCIKEYGFSLDSSLLQISRDFTNDNGQFRLIVEEYNQLKPVTIRDLLQHSSGLPSYDQTTAYLYRMSKNPKKTWQTEAYLDLITGVDVEFCDGYWKEKRGVHALSATNYFLAGIALESITGQSLVDLMTQLFEQHGLVNTFYCPNGVVKKDLSNLVHGYMPTSFPYADIFRSLPIISYNGSRELRAYDVTAAYNLNGLAGMAGLSSITDLIAWMQILWRERLFGDPMSTFFGRPASIHREGKKNRGEFGLGFRRAKLYPYGELIWSKGRVYGYETLMGYSLDKDLTFALAVNSNRSPLRMLTGSELVDDFFEQVLS
jgi:D-alanyl-D-alanine carboxypeptidase